MTSINSKVHIGKGIYTLSDVSKILNLEYSKVNSWVSRYWDALFVLNDGKKHSWKVKKSKAVGFYTLIEIRTLYLLHESGVSTRNIANARMELSKHFDTQFPFADRRVLKGLKSDGKRVYIKLKNKGTIALDGTKQFNFDFIKVFFMNLDFENDQVIKYFPLGKKKRIVVDPKRQFGHPVLTKSNIYPETLYNMYLAGESQDFIAEVYSVDKKSVADAIEYCKKAA